MGGLTAPGTGVVAVAVEAIELAQSRPGRALELAERAAASADPEARSMADRARGLVALKANDVASAVAYLTRAVATAEAAGLVERAGEARMTLAWALDRCGRTRDALRESRRALDALTGLPLARARVQHGMLEVNRGAHGVALGLWDEALPVLRAHGDRTWEARLLSNRGVVHGYQGRLGAAEADLTSAEQLHLSLDHDAEATEVRHNLGWLAVLRGDLPAALALFDTVQEEYRRQDAETGVLLVDRCEALIVAHREQDAVRAAQDAVAWFRTTDRLTGLAEAQLMLADAAILACDRALAATAAAAARRAFAEQDRPGWEAVARYAGLRADALGGEPGTADLSALRSVAGELERSGRHSAALDAHLQAARTAVAQEQLDVARTELAAAREAPQDRVDLRIRFWHTQALVRLASQDRPGASRAVTAGLEALDAHRARLGATELRAQASAHADELARLGLELAIAGGRAEAVLAAAERRRAAALRSPRVPVPADSRRRAVLRELRALVAARPPGEGNPAPPELAARQAQLEVEIRRLDDHAPGAGSALSPAAAEELLAALGERALVEWVAIQGRVHAVVLAGSTLRTVALADLSRVSHELAFLALDLARTRGRGGDTRVRAEASRDVLTTAGRLDEWLLRPLRELLGDRPLVVVPTGALHAVPWAVLPSCRGRAVSVAPSATLWLRAQAVAGGGWSAAGHVAGIAGPGLEHAHAEVTALRDRYRGATCLTGPSADVESVTRLLREADCAHIAAHGDFRSDNPQFSSIALADGPLCVYDLEALERTPRHFVLSACASGRSVVHSGDELMGLSAALFAGGAATLIASLAPVPDDATRDLMLDLHDHLSAGVPPAAALAAAQDERRRAEPEAIANWACFVCFGAG